MRSCFFENSGSREKKTDVASLTPSSEGENTQDKDLKGEISAGTGAPGEMCQGDSIFFILLRRRRQRRLKTRNRRRRKQWVRPIFQDNYVFSTFFPSIIFHFTNLQFSQCFVT